MKLIGMILALVFFCMADSAQALSVKAPKTLRPYEAAVLSVDTKEGGTLSVLVSDRRGEELPVVQGLRVESGATRLTFDATTYAGMPLKKGKCTFTFLFAGDGGTTQTFSADAQVRSPAASLQYALPRGQKVYQKPLEKWSIDCAVSAGCSVNLEILGEGEKPLVTMRKKLSNGGIFRLFWDLKKGGTLVSPGEYTCRVYVVGQKEKAVTFPLLVLEGKEPQAAAPAARPILPETLSDDAIWALMTAPMTVADAKSTEHVPVYADKEKTASVGTIHGQSQAVEILEWADTQCRIRFYRQEDGAISEGWIEQKSLKTVQPDGRYGVLIDLSRQTLTVYENGQKIGLAKTSTGRETLEGKYYRGALPGLFMVTERIAAFVSKGYRYEYPLRIDGGNLIHQVGLDQKTLSASDELSALQTKASAGCVRVDYRTDETFSVNAYWLWSHLPYGTAVLVLA